MLRTGTGKRKAEFAATCTEVCGVPDHLGDLSAADRLVLKSESWHSTAHVPRAAKAGRHPNPEQRLARRSTNLRNEVSPSEAKEREKTRPLNSEATTKLP